MFTLSYLASQNDDLGLLIRQIIAVAESKGFELGRWQTNSKRSGWCERITYALYKKGADRPKYAKDVEGIRCYLYQTEGCTKRCIAYKELGEFLEKVKGIENA